MIEFLSAVAFVSALVCVVCFFQVKSRAAQCYRDARIGRINADELSLAHQRLDMLSTALKRIEGRQVKAAGRAKAASDDGEPDSKADPEAWKAWQNRKLMAARMKTS